LDEVLQPAEVQVFSSVGPRMRETKAVLSQVSNVTTV